MFSSHKKKEKIGKKVITNSNPTPIKRQWKTRHEELKKQDSLMGRSMPSQDSISGLESESLVSVTEMNSPSPLKTEAGNDSVTSKDSTTSLSNKRGWKTRHEELVREGSLRMVKDQIGDSASEMSTNSVTTSPVANHTKKTNVSNIARNFEQSPTSDDKLNGKSESIDRMYLNLANTSAESSSNLLSPGRNLLRPKLTHNLSEVSATTSDDMNMPLTARSDGPKLSPRLNLVRPKRPNSIRGAHLRQTSELQCLPASDTEGKKNLVYTPEIEKRRLNIVNEILSTEKTYVQSLERLIGKYVSPVRKYAEENPKVIPNNFCENVFSNTETILPFNKNLMNDLEKIVAEWNSESKIGDIFIKFLPFLKVYASYSNNYDTALKTLDETSTNQWFETIIGNRLELESLLITPIQRIPRYSMLLSDLWKHTPLNHPDNANLERALQTCKNVANHVNTAIAFSKNSERLTMLGLSHLLEPARRLILEGNLTISLVRYYDGNKPKKGKKEYQFFLFNDLLVFMKPRKELKGKDSLSRQRSPSSIKVKQVWDPSLDTAWPLELVWLNSQLNEKDVFEIIGPIKTVTVVTKEKEKWCSTISNYVQNILTERDSTIPENAAEKMAKRYGRFGFSTGETYEGWWDLGRMHGIGISEFLGTYYEGEYALNQKSGKGKMEFTDGQVYEGEFRSGVPQGFGVSVNRTGDKYVGEWHKGKRHGKGELIFFNGDSYTGEWKENHIEGQGTLKINAFSVTYTGSFVGGKYHGRGILVTNEGTYTGSFDLGRQTGEGKLEYKSGVVYEGSWKNGLKHGQGKLITKEGVYVGNFSKDLKEGKGRMDYSDGSLYEGYFHEGKRHGKGTWTNPKGYVTAYNGDWVYDTREGNGEITFLTGDKYIGVIVAGQPHGQGRMIMANGWSFLAKFNSGVMEGKTEMYNDKGEVTQLTETGQVVGQTEGVEVLAPPFFPVLQYT